MKIRDNIKIIIYHAKQCNVKQCTALKLKKFGLAKVVYSIDRIPRNSIVLNPFSDVVLSIEDRKFLKNGLVALDCSWRFAKEVFCKLSKKTVQRRLPLFVAANPVNYGKVAVLSTAEALFSALYILGYKEEAKKILSKFKWGETFIRLNKNLLEDYSNKDKDGIIEIEKEYFEW